MTQASHGRIAFFLDHFTLPAHQMPNNNLPVVVPAADLTGGVVGYVHLLFAPSVRTHSQFFVEAWTRGDRSEPSCTRYPEYDTRAGCHRVPVGYQWVIVLMWGGDAKRSTILMI